jgi:hypothetical protein
MPDSKVSRLAELGKRKVALTAKLAEVHAEECAILSKLLADHGPAAGVSGPIMTAASEPKTK